MIKTQLAQTWQLCVGGEPLIAMEQRCVETGAQIIH